MESTLGLAPLRVLVSDIRRQPRSVNRFPKRYQLTCQSLGSQLYPAICQIANRPSDLKTGCQRTYRIAKTHTLDPPGIQNVHPATLRGG
jgi:hypothetical protein